MLRTLLPENVRLKLEIVAPDAMVLADAGSLEQILLNLVTNSRDALPQGGEVSVRVVEEEVDETYCLFHPGMKPGRYACLEVGDTGTGMNADTLSRIFDPFFTTKDPAAGTGLGMAMVYGLTRQQGGQVKVYSELGEGTLTRLYFPFHEGAEVRGVATRQEGRGWTGSATVLLVEDEESVRAAAALALRRSGFTVLTATEGAEALEIYAAYGEEIDLVFSDLVLPRMSGLELREELNAQYGPVRFILTSGYSGDHLANAGGLDPAVPFVRKPWTLNELLGTVRHVLETDPPRWVAARSPTE